jgi:hypothetical protein
MSDNSVGTNQPETKKTGSNKVIILIGIAIIILLLVVIVILLLRKPTASESTSSPAAQASQEPKREVLVSEDNIEVVIEQMEEETASYSPPGMYVAQMNFEWHFTSGDAESYDSYVANAIENTTDVYFDLFLADDMDNSIYESPIIPVGSVVRNVRLNKDLDAGTYDSVLVYTMVDGNQNSLGTVSFTVTLIVEK